MKFTLTIELTHCDDIAKIATLAALIEDVKNIDNAFSYEEMAEALRYVLNLSGLLVGQERQKTSIFYGVPTNLEKLCREIGEDHPTSKFFKQLATGYKKERKL